MEKVNLKQLRDLLPHFYNQKRSLYLWGKPSTAKTATFRQFGKEMADKLKLRYSETEYGKDIFTVKIITLSQYDAPDLRGMPQVIEKDGRKLTKFFTTDELPQGEGQGILFFDELNLADFSLQAPVYQIINDGRFGDLDFSENFWRVSASNKEDDFSNVNQMSLALLSRFSHLEVIPDSEEIIKHFLEKQVDERVIGYLNNYSEDLFPKRWDDNLVVNKANPFPRQWEYASNLIKDLDTARDSSVMQMLVGSCVGTETSVRFMAYSKLANKIKIDEIIAKPERIKDFERDEQRASIFYSIISSLAVKWFASDKKLTGDKVIEICNVLPIEMATAFLKMISEKRINSLLTAKGGSELLTRIFDIAK